LRWPMNAAKSLINSHMELWYPKISLRRLDKDKPQITQIKNK